MKQTFRIAIGAIFTESNHRAGTFTDLACFERSELRRGEEVLTATDGVVGGMVGELRERAAEITPLIVATACPGGILTEDCYRELKTELLVRLEQALPVDGILLPMHGAAAAEGVGDLEGDLLREVRTRVGTRIPVVATLDLHAHVTEAMVQYADALLAWETYPHRDSLTTGVRGARMLFDILEGVVKPAMALAKVPVIVSAFHGSTEGSGPFAEIMRLAKSLEGREEVVSTSAFLVHPYLDLPDMGSGGLVVANGCLDTAVDLATEIAEMFWQRRFDLEPTTRTPVEAISEGFRVDGGPVLLLEASDCVGGGAAGDSVAALRALLEARLSEPSLAMVVDPEAAAKCHQAAVGSEITLRLGHQIDTQWGEPISVTGRIEKLTDGRFLYSGGMWGGQRGDMGPCAKLRIGPVEVLIASNGTYDWADEQYRAMEMDTEIAKFIVVKNPMNYRVGYSERFKASFLLDTPGPTPASLRHLRFQRLKRPYFPADENIPNIKPVVFRHEAGPFR